MLFIRNIPKNRSIIDAARKGALNLPVTPFLLNKKAEKFLLEKNTEQAEKLVAEALKLDPGDTDSLTKLGYILFERNQNAKAKEVFQEILSLNPDDTNALFYLGRISENEGEHETASRYYMQVLRFSPDFTPAKEGLRRIETGKIR